MRGSHLGFGPQDRRGRLAALMAGTMLAGPALAQTQGAPAAHGAPMVGELIVTAQKREENIQNVPVSIQALGTTRLEQLNVSKVDDYVKFLPSVSYQTFGPGSARIYMRGVASGENRNHSGPLPSVGVYLDEQPITTIQGELDIHIYDIARVEALAGPQGTLYGASSEAGTIRIITNKPKIGAFEAAYDVDVNNVSHGEVGYGAEGFVNLPVSDKAAIRLVGWGVHDAGYIDNVPGTLSFPTAGVTISNADRAKDDYNDVDTWGGRAALRIDLDENWTVTPTFMGQDQRSRGLFAYDPKVGDLQVKHFYPEGAHDRWGQAALTIEGKISNFDIVYAGAYLRRALDSQSDYSDYSYFYDALYGYYLTDDSGAMINPSQHIDARDRFTKMSHELRVSSPADKRLRVVAGLFYQRQVHNIEQRYIVDDLASSTEVTGWPDTLWLTEQQRVDRDYAAFGEATFDLTKQLSLTGGLRAFKFDNSLIGFFGFGTGYSSSLGEGSCFAPTVVRNGPCTNLDKRVKGDGITHRLNLTYHFDDDRMVYATWSRGYRPGGINRRGTLPPYVADYLSNYEAGWKTTWLDGRLRINGALFWEDWDSFQFSFLGQNGLTEIKNAGQARIKGVEADVNWRPTEGLTLSAAGAYINAELTENYCGFTDPSGVPVTDCPDPKAPKGAPLPVTPKFKMNATARYEWNFADMRASLQGSLVSQTDSWADLRVVEREILGKQEGFTSVDFSAGLTKERWSLTAYLTNAFDTRAQLYRYAECAVSVCGGTTYVAPSQPRTLGVRFGQRF